MNELSLLEKAANIIKNTFSHFGFFQCNHIYDRVNSLFIAKSSDYYPVQAAVTVSVIEWIYQLHFPLVYPLERFMQLI